MSFETATRTRLASVRKYPTDLAIVSFAAVLAYVAVTSLAAGNGLRLFATVALVVFLPGYAAVSVLFPTRERSACETATAAKTHPRGIDTVERFGLSVALSVAIVPLGAMILAVTEWGIATEPAAGALSLGTVVVAQVGVVRRFRTPESERFTLSLTTVAAVVRRDSGEVTAASAVLVVAIGLAVGALLLGVLAPTATDGFTELGLYSETDDGDLVAGELPDEVEPGEPVPITIAIENHEREHTEYAVVVQQQQVENGEVVERTALEEIDGSVSAGGIGTGEYSVTPAAEEGETVRISVLLYYDEPPLEPTNENAVEDTYVWVTVTEGEDDG
ncbi:DUF1616 domain-containing protein [Natronobacterium gregoryi]|nr:DUF1616 domain-containing protein [Natronobacterium gregoryi]AFZ74121.1 putative membrane protein [Natronobacterium gregoryi SP2]PLK22099.1 DUF1616 domain-containing protein [Natronobacterium gregoryi SP2]SFI49838.1 Uncharacterized membrane protein [Natronobacterium gregoryi]